MGTDAAVQAVREAYAAAQWHFKLYASGVLGRVHTDLAVRACIELLEKEDDPDLQSGLAQSLVAHFSPEGNEVARKVLLGDPDLFDLGGACVGEPLNAGCQSDLDALGFIDGNASETSSEP